MRTAKAPAPARSDPAGRAGGRLDRFHAVDPALLRLSPGDWLLDLGCGTGRHTLEASRRPCHVVAADLSGLDLLKSRYLLEIMRRRGEVEGRVHFMQADGFHLPFVSGLFDRILCTETLEHVRDDLALVQELVRVLKAGGVLAVSVPDEYSESIFWALSWTYRNMPGGHVRIYSRRGLLDLLREAGLRPYAVRFRHSLESLYWLALLLSGDDLGQPRALLRSLRRFLNSPLSRRSEFINRLDDLGNYILPKSIVAYARKPPEASP